MKMNKVLIIVGTLLLFSTTVYAKTITLATLDYQQDDLAILKGNFTGTHALKFVNSTHVNKNDVNVTALSYDSAHNFTILTISSEDITYDYTFVNDTKVYYFNSTAINSTDRYLIYVNYKAIHPPASPWIYFVNLLALKNATIVNLTKQIVNMTNSTNSTNGAMDSLLEQLVILREYKNTSDPIVADYKTLSRTNKNQSIEIASLTGDKNKLTEEKASVQKSLDAISSPFAITYPKGQMDIFYFNLAWFAIGGVFCVLIFIFFTSKRTAGIRGKGKEKISERVHRKEEEPLAYSDMRQERPEVEKDILKKLVSKEKPKPISKPTSPPPTASQKSVESDIDDVINSSKVENTLYQKVRYKKW